MSGLLSAREVDEVLTGIPGWVRAGDCITRTWEGKGFNAAVQLVNVIAFVVNRLNHHPEILVHGYRKVTVTSTTHDANGITDNDLELARRLNAVIDRD